MHLEAELKVERKENTIYFEDPIKLFESSGFLNYRILEGPKEGSQLLGVASRFVLALCCPHLAINTRKDGSPKRAGKRSSFECVCVCVYVCVYRARVSVCWEIRVHVNVSMCSGSICN